MVLFSVVTKFPKEQGITEQKQTAFFYWGFCEKSRKKESCVHIEWMSNIA